MTVVYVRKFMWVQRHTKESFDANVIMQLLVYARLLFPGSKKAAFENREKFFEKTNYSLDDLYRCLSFLNTQRESLQIWMNQKIKEVYGRDSSLIYYDVPNYYFETDEQGDFLHKGVSKEHRPNPIVRWGYLWTTTVSLLHMNFLLEIQMIA